MDEGTLNFCALDFFDERVQAFLEDTVGSVPDHCSEASCDIFAGGGSCLQLVNTPICEVNKTRPLFLWGGGAL